MTTEEITVAIISYYGYFIRAIGYKNYTTKPLSANEKKVTEHFIQILQKQYSLSSIGPNFLFQYFTFQFQYYSTLKMRWGKWIMLPWIIGEKAFKRWEKKKENWWYWCEKFLQEKNVKFDEIVHREINGVTLNQWEELEKGKYFNTDKGLVNCLNHTTLYNSHSLFCMRCQFRRKCKYLLQLNYSLLAKRREDETTVIKEEKSQSATLQSVSED